MRVMYKCHVRCERSETIQCTVMTHRKQLGARNRQFWSHSIVALLSYYVFFITNAQPSCKNNRKMLIEPSECIRKESQPCFPASNQSVELQGKCTHSSCHHSLAWDKCRKWPVPRRFVRPPDLEEKRKGPCPSV